MAGSEICPNLQLRTESAMSSEYKLTVELAQLVKMRPSNPACPIGSYTYGASHVASVGPLLSRKQCPAHLDTSVNSCSARRWA